MSQLSFFDKPGAIEPRQPNLDYIRKHLNRLLRLTLSAERLPWSEAETKSWERLFPELARLLPADEGGQLLSAFEAEIMRLRAPKEQPER